MLLAGRWWLDGGGSTVVALMVVSPDATNTIDAEPLGVADRVFVALEHFVFCSWSGMRTLVKTSMMRWSAHVYSSHGRMYLGVDGYSTLVADVVCLHSCVMVARVPSLACLRSCRCSLVAWYTVCSVLSLCMLSMARGASSTVGLWGEPTPIVSEFAARGCLRRAVNEYSCDHELRGDRGLLSTAVRRTARRGTRHTQGQAQALAADE